MEHNYNSLTADYKKTGYVVVDDFLPEDVADKLESVYSKENNNWEFIDQYRDQKYGKGKYGLFKTNSLYLPGENEVYTAKFWRSNKLELKIENIFDEYFKPPLKSISQSELTEYDVRCYKLDEGCHYRTHIDDWAGNIGCIYYINKKWVWDWGGILHVGFDDNLDEVVSIRPKFNRAIFIDHGGFRFPHFISPITEYALNPRFTIISFNK